MHQVSPLTPIGSPVLLPTHPTGSEEIRLGCFEHDKQEFLPVAFQFVLKGPLLSESPRWGNKSSEFGEHSIRCVRLSLEERSRTWMSKRVDLSFFQLLSHRNSHKILTDTLTQNATK